MNRIKNNKWLYVCLFSFVGSSLWGVSCDSGWVFPLTLSPIYQTGNQPKVAIDNQKNALAIWRLYDGDSFRIQSARYNALTNLWTPFDQLVYLSESVNSQGSYEQQLSMNSAGNAIAVWCFDQGDESSIQASSFHALTKMWDPITSVTTLSDVAENSYFPHISLALNNNGDGFAVWQWDDLIQAARYDGNVGWQAAVDISATDSATTPDVATSSNGNATAVWTIWDNDDAVVQSSSYASGSWTPIASLPLLSATGGDAYWPCVAMDSSDNALAVWYRYDSNGNAIIQSSFKPSGQPWTGALYISDPGEDAFYPRVAMNAAGAAIVMWYRFDGQTWRIQARHRSSSGVWSQIYTISSPDYDAFAPVVIMDDQGNGFAAWKIYDSVGNARIQVGCYDASTQQWTPPSQQPLLSPAGANADYPDIAVNQEGNVVVGWQWFDGRNWRIQVITQTAPEPPQNLRASKYVRRDSRYPVVVICWDAPHGDIAGYNVYHIDPCTGMRFLPANIPASQGTCFCHYGRKIGCTDIYEVSSVDNVGNESEKVRVIVS